MTSILMSLMLWASGCEVQGTISIDPLSVTVTAASRNCTVTIGTVDEGLLLETIGGNVVVPLPSKEGRYAFSYTFGNRKALVGDDWIIISFGQPTVS